MSADLFAAFGIAKSDEDGNSTTPTGKSRTNAARADEDRKEDEGQWILQSQPMPQPLRRLQETPLWNKDSKGADILFDASDDDLQNDDEFGDFEAAATEATNKALPSNHQQPQQRNTDLLGLDDFSNLHVTQSHVHIPQWHTSETGTSDLLGIDTSNQIQPNTHVSQSVESSTTWPESSTSTGLQQKLGIEQQDRDQDQEPVDEDWGNFEDAEGDGEAGSEEEVVVKRDHRTRVKAMPTKAAEVTIPQPLPAEVLPDDEQWDDFEDSLAPTSRSTQESLNPSPSPGTALKASNPTTTSQHQPPTPRQRPINIPPPSTLLQLLPQIYQSLSSQSRQPSLFPNLAQETLQIYIATARLLAGRPYRWKRDTLLSQSTRISQAGLKNTGMKLTALDRSETIKEDQEAQEAVSAWKRHAAVLNAVMLKAKVQKPPMSLSVSMGVKVASGVGVLNARECCAVCGLKRNERILGIDVSVEDSFGEFWVEFWGHRGCADFWYEYEEMLRQR